MEPLSGLQEGSSFIYQKLFQVTHTCDDFLVGSGLLSKSTKDVLRGEYLQDKITSLQGEKVLIKNILEEEIFKLKQHYQTLKTMFRELAATVSSWFARAQFEISQKAAILSPQSQLQNTILEMKEKVSSIEVSNRILRQQNEKMLAEIETLRVTVNQSVSSDTRPLPDKEKEDKEELDLKTQLNEKQRMIKYLEYKEEQALKTRRYDSRQSYRTITNPQPYPQSPYKQLRLGIQKTNLTSPVVRQRKSEVFEDSEEETSRVYGARAKKDGSFTFTRIRQQVIREQEKPKLITRKPGVPTTFYKPPRHAINLSQLESRLDNIKKELYNEIRSVEKRRF